MINHTITVRNRRIKVDTPRLIQGCDGSDAIILDLDDEWTGLDEILVSIGSGDSRQDAFWDGEPTNSPRGDTTWITGTVIVAHSFQSIMQLCAYAPSYHNAGFAFRNGPISDTSDITWHEWHEIAFLDDLPDASALADEMGDIASLSTRVQALEARVKSLETN